MDVQREGNLASDGAGILTGLGLLIVAFYVIPGARGVPPLFRATAGILLSLINIMVWSRPSAAPPLTPRDMIKAVTLVVGLIAINVVLDTLSGVFFGARTFTSALLAGWGGGIDCLLMVIAVFVGIPTLVRSMFLYCGWGREW